MSPLLDTIFQNGLLFEALGVIGLGLIALASLRLAKTQKSWGGTLMATGAIGLLIARLYLLGAPFFMNDEVLHQIGPVGIALTIGLPPLLLTFGLAGIVWGLWGHERWMRSDSH